MCGSGCGGCYKVNMTPDNELLRQYARARTEEAFAELVRRHVDLVYCAALRQVGGDAHLAQDVAQSVFTDLARKAASLSHRESLTGWLYTSAHFAAAKIARTESRRRDREEKFMREPSHDTSPEADWEKLRPMLDSVMHELKEGEREAVLLRYFENRPFAEVGAKLCVTENAARMRVERAVEKLRAVLAKRGITTGTALASVISANAIQTAPGHLAATLASASIAGAGGGALVFSKFMTATNLKLGLGALATAAIVVAFIGQQRSQKALRGENQSLGAQIAQLKADNAELSDKIAATGDSQATAREQLSELLKLRAEVTQLRAMKTAPAEGVASPTNNAPASNKTAINLKIKFVSLPAESVQTVTGGLLWSGDTSILSEQQFELFNNALGRGAHSATESQITTASGREAVIRAQEPVHVNGTNANVGTTLDVLPYFLSDASIFTLNLAARLDQLTGNATQPGVQTIQASNHVTLFPGQTVALKAQMPDAANNPNTPDELLVFVTPKNVDAGETNSPSPSEASRAQAMETMNEAKQGVLAMLMFAEDNEKQYPTNLDEVSRYLNGSPLVNELETNFDLVSPSSITNVAQPATTIVLKEKQAWQGPDGNWLKTYGFADGHAEVHSEASGNFDDFENQHMISAASQ